MMSVLRSQCEQGKISVSAKYILYMIIVHFASLVVAYLYTLQRSKLTFSKNRLLATFNCKMVAIKRNSVAKKNLEVKDTL